jgi:glycerophosphoryl diester phosphodiesterase
VALFAASGSPVRIAHGAGNHRGSLRAAVAAGVDMIEADVWLVGGQIVARHEKAFWRLPVLYDKWSVRLAERPPLYLPEICAATANGPELLLDLKGHGEALSRRLVAVLQQLDAVDRVAICSQDWRLLDAARAIEPRLRSYYSFETQSQLRELRARSDQPPAIAGVSVWEGLLTPELIGELAGRGLQSFAWTVNSPERATELVIAGVSGIISDRIDLLAELTPLSVSN